MAFRSATWDKYFVFATAAKAVVVVGHLFFCLCRIRWYVCITAFGRDMFCWYVKVAVAVGEVQVRPLFPLSLASFWKKHGPKKKLLGTPIACDVLLPFLVASTLGCLACKWIVGQAFQRCYIVGLNHTTAIRCVPVLYSSWCPFVECSLWSFYGDDWLEEGTQQNVWLNIQKDGNWFVVMSLTLR